MDVLRKALAEQVGQLFIANVELSVHGAQQAEQIAVLTAEIETLKKMQSDGKARAEQLLNEVAGSTEQ